MKTDPSNFGALLVLCKALLSVDPATEVGAGILDLMFEKDLISCLATSTVPDDR